ncbi:uncharacterized protein A4U43_C01F26310 [Asparagus officinalis]|uniref:Uncharacterized protein n=1 Tax=Asparagus officinalis TaxID=4686 RepID=A0A5P1FSX0_ASPOF|nr:uncharacterized protein LOC109843670 [Asparagus officinalis]ONK81192.1 uncharacterized protein A4U43_C01F26310 [Asparagus officinalis]
MAKLATARDCRVYGPRPIRHRWEYINAGIYVFATALLVAGFSSQLSAAPLANMTGLVVVLIGISLVAVVNGHDLVAHMAGIDYCVTLIEFDPQLALVEFGVPLVVIVGCVLGFTGVLLVLVQMARGYSYKLEKHALNLLIAAPACWVLGSIQNLCQVYERSNGHVQLLQKSVQIPFLMASLLFLVGGFFNQHHVYGSMLLAKSWIWLCIFGSLLFFVGGLLHVGKVFKMQQMDGMRLEKLRGGALERLVREREGKVPLILKENRRRRRLGEEEDLQVQPPPVPASSYKETPYKDVLIGGRSLV